MQLFDEAPLGCKEVNIALILGKSSAVMLLVHGNKQHKTACLDCRITIILPQKSRYMYR
jgi:hypothetical protein